MPDVPKQLGGEQSAVDGFIKTVLKSGLLNPRQVEEAKGGASVEVLNDPKALADLLVKSGKLTRFQAGKLLAGISLGLVFGPYHILNAIGRGGMGSVFLARDSRDQRLVAVKVLPPKKAKAQERLVARFKREMEICQRVSHPHLTKTFEVGSHLNVNYIAMEYIPGKTMYWLVKEQGPFKVPRTARLFAEVALGLDYAHSQGLIHRDLKPSNIMVMPDDRAKILDMGLALMQGEDEPTVLQGKGHIVGTPDYLAPEQADDPLKVDFRSDIYSLGCTLYFALTGSAPFSGGGTLQKMLRHRTEAPVPVGQINPSVPAAFAGLLTHMLAKRPEHRYKSAAALRDALLPWAIDHDGRKFVPVADGKKPAEPEPVPSAMPAEPAPVAVLLTEPARQGVPVAEPVGKLPPPAEPAAQPPAAKPKSPAAAPAKPQLTPESPPVSSKPAGPIPPRPPPAPETSAPPGPPASTKPPPPASPRPQPEAGPLSPRPQQQLAGPPPMPPRPAAEAGPASANRPIPPPAPPRPAAEAGPASANRPTLPPAPPRPAAEAGPASAKRSAPTAGPPAETAPSPLLQMTTIDPNILAALATTPQEDVTPAPGPETPFAVDFLLPVLFSGFILAGLWVLLMLLLLRM